MKRKGKPNKGEKKNHKNKCKNKRKGRVIIKKISFFKRSKILINF